jgi:hypothetical protein
MPSRKRTTEEKQRILAAVEALRGEDLRDLADYARFRSTDFPRMGVGDDADDLLQTVLLKAWMAQRGCAIDVNAEAFFKSSIKSVANQKLEWALSEAANRNEFRHYQARCSGTPDKSRQIAHNIVAAVRDALSEDAEALEVLNSMLDEKPRRETCRALGMEIKAYDTARKRIARRTRHAAAIATAGFGRSSFFRHR